jgi:hypothetical protein
MFTCSDNTWTTKNSAFRFMRHDRFQNIMINTTRTVPLFISGGSESSEHKLRQSFTTGVYRPSRNSVRFLSFEVEIYFCNPTYACRES